MMEALGLVTKTTKGFLEVNQISVDNWTFKFFYKVRKYPSQNLIAFRLVNPHSIDYEASKTKVLLNFRVKYLQHSM